MFLDFFFNFIDFYLSLNHKGAIILYQLTKYKMLQYYDIYKEFTRLTIKYLDVCTKEINKLD